MQGIILIQVAHQVSFILLIIFVFSLRQWVFACDGQGVQGLFSATLLAHTTGLAFGVVVRSLSFVVLLPLSYTAIALGTAFVGAVILCSAILPT